MQVISYRGTHSVDQDIVIGAAKSAPPVVFFAGHYLLGLTVQEAISFCMLFYAVSLGVERIWKLYKFLRDKKYLREKQ